MYISFNKGKTFYQIDSNASLNNSLEVLSKLNQKTWNSIVSKMEDKVIEKFDNVSYSWNEIKFSKDFGELNNDLEEKINRLNMLRKYLFYYQIVHKTDKFIV